MKKIAIAILALAAVISGVFYYQSRPEPVTKYMGVSLGDSKEQVEYVLGSPTDVYKEASPEMAKPFLDAGFKTVPYEHGNNDDIRTVGGLKKYPYWVYVTDALDVGVTFNQETGKLTSILCGAHRWNKDPNKDKCKINGIGLKDSEASVIKHLGKPDSESIKNGLKSVFYARFNLYINFERESVYSIMVTKELPL